MFSGNLISARSYIIFVVAGTNQTELLQDKIGSPADSINSLVVNSIKRDGTKASYSRRGKVLSFLSIIIESIDVPCSLSFSVISTW